ncbi:uncharacterized protein G2W53_017963 [Senna tora]|uniref:Uncharacterized protein n=1 Tax=Senna tora TaxID=362788 RepID=A0A834TZN7_9FABA|nr:uncharacterized protein G2W53_017963 [Senna tora]
MVLGFDGWKWSSRPQQWTKSILLSFDDGDPLPSM